MIETTWFRGNRLPEPKTNPKHSVYTTEQTKTLHSERDLSSCFTKQSNSADNQHTPKEIPIHPRLRRLANAVNQVSAWLSRGNVIELMKQNYARENIEAIHTKIWPRLLRHLQALEQNPLLQSQLQTFAYKWVRNPVNHEIFPLLLELQKEYHSYKDIMCSPQLAYRMSREIHYEFQNYLFLQKSLGSEHCSSFWSKVEVFGVKRHQAVHILKELATKALPLVEQQILRNPHFLRYSKGYQDNFAHLAVALEHLIYAKPDGSNAIAPLTPIQVKLLEQFLYIGLDTFKSYQTVLKHQPFSAPPKLASGMLMKMGLEFEKEFRST